MANIQGGINGPFSGKVGTVVGVQWKGKFYMRSAPKKRTDRRGEKERANQSDFSKVHNWLRPVLGFIRAGFNNYPGRTHAFNAAKSFALKNAFTGKIGERVFDPTLVQLSWGDLPLPQNISVAKTGDLELTFTWDTDFGAKGALPVDQALLLAYDDEQRKSFSMLNGQYRKTGTDQLVIPRDHPGNYHVYIAFMNPDRSMQSVSRYLGRIQVGA